MDLLLPRGQNAFELLYSIKESKHNNIPLALVGKANKVS
jgi:hypothetical protein